MHRYIKVGTNLLQGKKEGENSYDIGKEGGLQKM